MSRNTLVLIHGTSLTLGQPMGLLASANLTLSIAFTSLQQISKVCNGKKDTQ